MMEIRLACEPAPDASENEDHAVAAPGFVAVMDGATVPPGMETGCLHGPAWLVRRLGAHLISTYTGHPDVTLPDLLAAAIDKVRAEHGGTCDLDHPGTPQSTACLLRTTDHHTDYLVLCDSPLVYESGGHVRVVTDLRLRETSRALRRLALTADQNPRSGNRDHPLRAFVESQRRYVNRPGGYWTAAATPEAAYQALTGTLPRHGPRALTRAALLTDGASRAVDTFGMTDWRGLLDLLEQQGPAELIRQVRVAERSDRRTPRFKRHDDATAAYCRVLREVR